VVRLDEAPVGRVTAALRTSTCMYVCTPKSFSLDPMPFVHSSSVCASYRILIAVDGVLDGQRLTDAVTGGDRKRDRVLLLQSGISLDGRQCELSHQVCKRANTTMTASGSAP
jgi:hypothetical protein